MENLRVVKPFLISMIGGTLFVLPFFVSGYDDTTTHRALTQEIINFFNYSYPDYEIPRSDGEEIIQGSARFTTTHGLIKIVDSGGSGIFFIFWKIKPSLTTRETMRIRQCLILEVRMNTGQKNSIDRRSTYQHLG